MIRFSIQTRQALAKLTLPLLIGASFGLMLLGKADTVLAERGRMALADALAPIYTAMAGPSAAVRNAIGDAAGLWTLHSENARLRTENEQLRRWQSVALALDAENQKLKANLNWMPEPAPTFVTVRAVADAGGPFGRAVLLAAGPNHAIRKGEIALDEHGLAGRVTEVGARTVRVLLLTDLNSRVPVVLEDSHGRAIAVGTNGPRPRLLYWPEGSPPREGEHVVTAAEAAGFPANLPVGTVHYTSPGVPELEPAADLARLEIVRVVDYGLPGIAPPETTRLPDRR